MPAIPSAKERSRNAVAQKAHRERKRAYIQQLEDKIRHYEQQGVPTSEQERLHQLESENAALRAEVEALKAERASPVSPVPSTSSSLDSLPTSTPAFPLLGALDSTDPLSSAASDSIAASDDSSPPFDLQRFLALSPSFGALPQHETWTLPPLPTSTTPSTPPLDRGDGLSSPTSATTSFPALSTSAAFPATLAPTPTEISIPFGAHGQSIPLHLHLSLQLMGQQATATATPFPQPTPQQGGYDPLQPGGVFGWSNGALGGRGGVEHGLDVGSSVYGGFPTAAVDVGSGLSWP